MPVASARLVISLVGSTVPSTPRGGEITASLENGSAGARWTDGQSSGQIDRIYRADGAVAAAATASYNVLTAGALTDLLGTLINLQKLKAFELYCISGAVRWVAPAANALALFGAATHSVALSAGQTLAIDFGAAGLSVGANGKFDVTDTAGGAGSTYSIMFVGSN